MIAINISHVKKYIPFVMLAILCVTGCASQRNTSPAARSMPPVTRVQQATPQPIAPPAIDPAVSKPTRAKKKEQAPQLLSMHHTTFNANEDARNTNIALAAKSINGAVIKPGQVFSFNDTVGPTIERRGYKKGLIYADGEKSEGFGGGVCQVSSTLYVAALAANMTIIERHDHSLPVTYAKPGDDAATSYGVIDFRFKNETAYPVTIKAATKGNKVTVQLYR